MDGYSVSTGKNRFIEDVRRSLAAARPDHNLRKKLPDARPVFAELMAAIGPEIVPDLTAEEVARWQSVIEPKDAPILAAAVAAALDRFLTLDVKDFVEPAQVAEKSGLRIKTPADFVEAVLSHRALCDIIRA